MSYLTHRAERALLGALLSDQPPPTGLQPDDFGNHLHQAVYAALTSARAEQPDMSGDRLLETVGVRVGVPEVDAAWLRALRDDCPNPEHVDAYARMVETAAFRRDIAAHGERIAVAAMADQQLTPLADALAQQIEANAALSASDEMPARFAVRIPAVPADPEDALLGGLLQHPDQVDDVAAFLPAEAVTDPERRSMYQSILVLAETAESIDEITVAWELERQRAEARLFPDRPGLGSPDVSPNDPDLAYLGLLAAAPVQATAVETGRALLADHLRRTLGHSHPDPGLVPTSPAALDPKLRQPPAPNGGPAPRIDR